MGVFLGRERRTSLTPTFPEPPIPPIRGTSPWGGQMSVAVNPDLALIVPTVWACVSLLANTVAMFPLETFRRVQAVPTQLPDPALFTNPSGSMTLSEWLHMIMMSLLLRGNSYGLVAARDNLGYPTQIDIYSPDVVKVNMDQATGKLSYLFGPLQKPVATDDVWHVRGLTLPGSKIGLSPIAYAAATIGVDIASRKFAGDFFDGGGIPKAVLQSDQGIDQEKARTLKERVLAATRNREPIVLGAGVQYKAISVAPEESQFLATQQADVAQIARYFNIPAGMVGGSEGGSMTYSNVEQRSIDFLTYAVSFWLKRLEDATTQLRPRPHYTRFNTAALLRTDAETAAKVDVQLIAAKIKAPSEVRSERQLPPMTDEQKAEAEMVPLTITPTGGPKALPPAAAPASEPDDDHEGEPAHV